MKLEVGRSYKNLVGGVCKIVYSDPTGYIFRDETGTAYDYTGGYFNCGNTSWDLIEEVTVSEGEKK